MHRSRKSQVQTSARRLSSAVVAGQKPVLRFQGVHGLLKFVVLNDYSKIWTHEKSALNSSILNLGNIVYIWHTADILVHSEEAASC